MPEYNEEAPARMLVCCNNFVGLRQLGIYVEPWRLCVKCGWSKAEHVVAQHGTADGSLNALADRDIPCKCHGGPEWSKYCTDHHDLYTQAEDERKERKCEAKDAAEKRYRAREAALMSAGMAWGGSANDWAQENRDNAILATADKFEAWLLNEETA